MPMYQKKISKNLSYRGRLLYTGKYLPLKQQDK